VKVTVNKDIKEYEDIEYMTERQALIEVMEKTAEFLGLRVNDKA
jgi:hypothetical protein